MKDYHRISNSGKAIDIFLTIEGTILRLRTFILLSIISFALFVGVNFLSAMLPSAMPKQAVAGKRVWQKNNCVSCHSLFGNGGYSAVDLTHITAQRTPAELVEYFVDPPVMRPNKIRRHPALTHEEAQNLVQYLEFVNTIPTLGWPPEPRKAGGGS